MTSIRRRGGWAALVGLALLASGCSHVHPWERSKLAHPSMTSDPVSPGLDHVHAIQEGAVGGGSAATSGCGCN